MYNGLTTADKGALLEAKAKGYLYVIYRENEPLSFWRTSPDRLDSIIGYDNIDIALAQIAEIESAEKPLTWNERINQMTAEEKAREFFYNNAGDHCFKGTPLENKPHYISINGEYCASSDEAIQAGIKWLNSPYTEGETK